MSHPKPTTLADPAPAPAAVAGAEGERAWTRDELAEDPHRDAGKPEKVRRMFGAIAHRYDLNNHLHSLWMDQLWRRAAVRAGGVGPGTHVLDVACGTGDLTELMARAGAERVVGADYTPEMLDLARRKLRRIAPARRANVEYVQADAQQLEFDDDSFDVVSIAFGIRNVERPELALSEFRRVLKPGGRLVILEFSEPRFAPIRWLSGIYLKKIMPLTATLIARDRSGAYRYLPRSVETFLSPEELSGAIEGAGFADLTVRRMGMGVCSCYRAVSPA